MRQRPPTASELARYQEKKAKREPLEEEKKAEWHWQASPFHPAGQPAKSSSSMDLKYAIDPVSQWADMTRYNSFVCELFPCSCGLACFLFSHARERWRGGFIY